MVLDLTRSHLPVGNPAGVFATLFQNLPNLNDLKVSSPSKEVYRHLPDSDRVEVLTIDIELERKYSTDDETTQIFLNHFLRSNRGLEVLKLSGCSISLILEEVQLPHLKALELAKCNVCDCGCFEGFLTGINKEIRRVGLDGNDSLVDELIFDSYKHFEKLESVYYCTHGEDDSPRLENPLELTQPTELHSSFNKWTGSYGLDGT
ncbi:hypothetical protein SAICODRAFT_27683 [Saitoella complicata NRRL Y-17804]|uniref:uncharacterized protein n=1 Tax=Saitoella complicata (strain BCRC 22490 / CBS 7301 / JCM 7358 / NBRC 10748 / NRRL Y-17804) TaxID=698492 RepID=UPI0008675F59|nr:uncharacterized protein SAICODRAFT_27683 [Saitoella complicata NRRL Y-17804]ODQ50229.1 hypothetical protein SAICODRAFT_27683 [Saitoella complicata NRRL Y-17804]